MHGTAHHLLVVEDSPDDARLTLRALRRADAALTVSLVSGVGEAIDWLGHQPPPHLVITDYNMGGADGNDLVRWIHAHGRYSEVPVVVFTGSAASHRTQLLSEGASDVIDKPTDAHDYQDAIAQILRQWVHG